MKKKIRIIPSTNTLKGIGVSGRNPAQNMMDLVDNSIDAMHDEETGVKVYHKQDVKIKWHKIKEMPEGYSEYENKEGWLITDQASGIKGSAESRTRPPRTRCT